MSSPPPTNPSATDRSAPSGLARAFAGRGGLIASVGAAFLGFGLAGASAAGPIQSWPAHLAGSVGAPAVTSSAGTEPERAAAAPTASPAGAAAEAARAEAARAEAARRPDRATRGTPAAPKTPAVPKTPAPRRTVKAAPAWVNPMPGAEVTSCYGFRWGTLHAGIDLAGPADTPIRAAAAGTVEGAGWIQAGYGISVLVDHGTGYLTHYGHMNRAAVSPGQRVRAGQVIGYEGSTGDSTGPHLHFEVHRGAWNQIDPAPWMREHGVNLGC